MTGPNGVVVRKSSIRKLPNVFGPPKKQWLCTEKTEGTSSLYLASGPLPNAANSSDVPTEFAGGDQPSGSLSSSDVSSSH